ncbi:MAG: hypothetical protein OXF02_01745 [Simkaniaceae bacterium]|nr:hypothetical protein [Simkaniaceae bacterium]
MQKLIGLVTSSLYVCTGVMADQSSIPPWFLASGLKGSSFIKRPSSQPPPPLEQAPEEGGSDEVAESPTGGSGECPIVPLTTTMHLKCLGEGVFMLKTDNKSQGDKKVALVSTVIKEQNSAIRSEGEEIDLPSIMTENIPEKALGLSSKALYAQKHGYDFIFAVKPPHSGCNTPESGKHREETLGASFDLLERFLPSYDLVFLSTPESTIIDFGIPVEAIIPEECDIIGSAIHPEGDEPLSYDRCPGMHLCNGVIRNSPFTQHLIATAKERKAFELRRFNAILSELPGCLQRKISVLPNDLLNEWLGITGGSECSLNKKQRLCSRAHIFRKREEGEGSFSEIETQLGFSLGMATRSWFTIPNPCYIAAIAIMIILGTMPRMAFEAFTDTEIELHTVHTGITGTDDCAT